jgi:membrane protease YdiL (CAAX protease family)
LVLLFKAGLALGFFFHSLLQSRLSIGLKSKFGGMIVSVLIFGFAHLPLLIDSGIPARHKMQQNPGLLLILAYCVAILAISHLFIAIIWRRSKNLWLIMGLYAVMALLPDLIQFLEVWKL